MIVSLAPPLIVTKRPSLLGGHAMSSLWHFRANKVQVFRRKFPRRRRSCSASAALRSAIYRSTGGRFGHPCHLAELRGQATDWPFSGGG
jgi:hypothetical protein